MDKNPLKNVVSVAEELHGWNQRTMRQLDDEEQQLGLRPGELELVRAKSAYVRHDYHTAVELFGRAFAKIDLTDKSVNVLTIVWYAVALARTGNTQTPDVAALAEKRLRGEPPTFDDEKHSAVLWWDLAEVYAILRDAESAVRCLDVCLTLQPVTVRRWLTSARNKEMSVGSGVATLQTKRHRGSRSGLPDVLGASSSLRNQIYFT